jgi:hypothetical protein
MVDGLLSMWLRRDVVELGAIEARPHHPGVPAEAAPTNGIVRRDQDLLAIGTGRTSS